MIRSIIMSIIIWGGCLLSLGLFAFVGMILIESRKQHKLFEKTGVRLINLERFILPRLDELLVAFNEGTPINDVYRQYDSELGVILRRRRKYNNGYDHSELLLMIDEIENLKGNIPLRVQKFYLMCATGKPIDIRNDDEPLPRWHTVNDYSQEYEDALKGEEIMEKLK